MAALSQVSWQKQPSQAQEPTSEGKLPEAHATISDVAFMLICVAEPSSHKHSGPFVREVLAPTSSSYSSLYTSVETPTTTVGRKAKQQPWRAVWPAPREPASQANIFGFKKGELMIFDGNAGNFFARDAWTIEQEVNVCPKQQVVGSLPKT